LAKFVKFILFIFGVALSKCRLCSPLKEDLRGGASAKYVTVNEALRIMDAAIFLAVIERDLTTHLSTPLDGAWVTVSGSDPT
jgi:hypothetical protein